MSLSVYGINHQTATLSIRERLAFTPSNTPDALRALLQLEEVNEAVILSTCHRTELYTDSHDCQPLSAWLSETCQTQSEYIDPYAYFYRDQEAVKHLMRVSSGLDSLILGESQIISQMKRAFELAYQLGSIGMQLHHLFPKVFATAKKVRTDTAVGRHANSLALMATKRASQIFANIGDCQALLIGAGDTISLSAKHLAHFGVKKWLFANRTPARAQKLANQYSGTSIPLQSIADYLVNTDIVISATHSPLPIIGKGMLETAVKQRRHQPLLLIDLSVPRNIEPEAGQLRDIYLYNVDDLKQIASQQQQQAVEQAHQIVNLHSAAYRHQLKALDAKEMVRHYRSKMFELRDQATQHAIKQLERGETPAHVIQLLAHRLSNQIMHQPCVRMKQAAANSEDKLLLAAKWLLDIEESVV